VSRGWHERIGTVPKFGEPEVAEQPGQIPIIDIGPFLAGEPAGKTRVVDQVKQACERIGFFTIVGHNVPNTLIAEVRNVANEFFSLPLEEKLRVQRSAQTTSRGYAVMGDVALAYTLGAKSAPDYQEGFSIGTLDAEMKRPYYQTEKAKKCYAPNQWPDRPPSFRPTLENYYEVMEGLQPAG
jgi:isopenicillin N synthase-like dioxygenase